MADVLVILPTYNELESLPSILGRLRQSLPEADVLVVDDSSPDGTGRLADSLAAEDPGIAVLHRSEKGGLGRAYRAGFAHALAAGYDYVIEIDADGSHDPAELPPMLDLAKAGAHLVIGSRWTPGGRVLNWPWVRQAISRTGNRYSRWALQSAVADLTSGFRVFGADALRSLDLDAVSSQGYCFQIEVAWRLEQGGWRIVEHPIVFVERAAGHSKMHLGIVIEALLRVTIWGAASRASKRRRT
ncbi:MAG: polyprenol monophosphomannose synthase [Microbacteriaceae bacterium]|nr:polyprenol monophosphomannose synthase [Microbacteriaceae bacterium]